MKIWKKSSMGIMILLVCVFVLQFVFSSVMRHFTGNNKILVIEIFAVLIPTLIYVFYKKTPFSQILPFKSISFTTIINLMLIGISAQTIAMMLNIPFIALENYVSPSAYIPPIAPSLTIADIFANIVFIAIIPSICEEFLMRGVVLNHYKNHGVKNAILITSFLFALIHGRFTDFIGLFFLGMILGYVVTCTENIFSAILLHLCFNVSAIFYDYINTKHMQTLPFSNTFGFSLILFLISLMIFGICISFFSIKKKKTI